MLLALFAGLLAQTAAPTPVAPAPAQLVRAAPSADLQRQLQAILSTSDADVGIVVLDPATGRTVAAVNGDRPYPMASTVKVAIAAAYLADVDAGRSTLNDMIAVDDRLRLRADGITFFAPHAGVTLSAANLIELMLTRSDNTATDVLLSRLGGPAVVQTWLDRNRLKGLRIDRSIAQLLLDRKGARAAAGQTAAEALRRWDPVAPGSVGEADNDNAPPAAISDTDLRDTATPAAFAAFLSRLYGTSLLKPASRDFLFSVMRRCITGSNRIKGLLPAGTVVEHKTGTLAGVTDDVGYIGLPDGRRLVFTAFAKGGANRPTAIARAARAAYDAFTASP
jgi:beta-lactamase class A